MVTGNPVRSSVISAERGAAREQLGMSDEERLLLVFGGSLGAAHLNKALASLKADILSRPDVHVIHSTGADGYDEALSELQLSDEEQHRWNVVTYISDMGAMLAAADLVVSRAGALFGGRDCCTCGSFHSGAVSLCNRGSSNHKCSLSSGLWSCASRAR